jgi:hypothetical protein
MLGLLFQHKEGAARSSETLLIAYRAARLHTLQECSFYSHYTENRNLTLKSSLQEVSLASSFSVRSCLLTLCKPGRAIELRAIHQSTSSTTRRVGFSKNWSTLMQEETTQLMAYCEKLSHYEMFGRTLMRIPYQNWQSPSLLSHNRSFWVYQM